METIIGTTIMIIVLVGFIGYILYGLIHGIITALYLCLNEDVLMAKIKRRAARRVEKEIDIIDLTEIIED